MTMRQTYRKHKFKITDATMEEFKRARRRELIRQGRPIPTTLLPNEPDELSCRHEILDDQQRLPF